VSFTQSFTKIAAAGALLFGFSAQAKPVPIEEFAKQPAVSSLSMSTEGDFLVGLVSAPNVNDGELSLAVWDLKQPSKPPLLTPSNDRMKFVAASALKQGKLFVVGRQAWTGTLNGCGEGRVTGATRTFVNKLYMTDVTMKKFDEPFKPSGRMMGNEIMRQCFEILNTSGLQMDLPLDPDSVVVSRLDNDTLQTEYVRVNLRTNEEKFLFRESSGTSIGLMDPRTGTVLTRSSIKPVDGDYEISDLILNEETGEFEEQPELTSKASKRFTVAIAGRDEASGKYYVITDKFLDKAALYFYDAKTKSFDETPLFAHPEFEVTGIWLGSKPSNFNQLLGVRYGGPTTGWLIVDPTWNAVLSGLEGAFPGREVNVIDYTDDMSKILFSTSSSNFPPAYYILTDKKILQELGSSRPGMDVASMRATEFTYYTARDGMQIPAFVTLPKGWKKEDGPIPFVVLPHGGPWARDDAGWDGSGWPQFLATRGYGVMQPQYRGSSGFGRELWLAGDGEWGQKMQDDKDDGAAWLVKDGYAKKDQIAIFGYSYGGFAAMAATVRENGPFRCAIAGAGVSNLTRIGNNWSESRLQRVIQGNTVKGMDPMRNTDKANIPILVYHGDRDVRVPLFHGVDFYNAVKSKVPAKLLVVEDMPHSLPWWPEQHRVTLKAIEDYLATDCGMKPTQTAFVQ
jgi:pimeloyl-ACP methyl ester carboxylesterase